MCRPYCIPLAALLAFCFPAAGQAVDFLGLLNDLGRWQGVGYSEGYHACRPDAQVIQPSWRQHLDSHRDLMDHRHHHRHHGGHSLLAPRPIDRMPTAPAASYYGALPYAPASEPQAPLAPPPPPVKTELPEAWKTVPEDVEAGDELPPIPPAAP